jgi:hypothetical protein
VSSTPFRLLAEGSLGRQWAHLRPQALACQADEVLRKNGWPLRCEDLFDDFMLVNHLGDSF